MSRACAECSSATEDDAELCPPCQEEADAARPRRAYRLLLGGEVLAEVVEVGWQHALLAFIGSECERVGTCDSMTPGVRHPDRIERDGRAWVSRSWGWERVA